MRTLKWLGVALLASFVFTGSMVVHSTASEAQYGRFGGFSRSAFRPVMRPMRSPRMSFTRMSRPLRMARPMPSRGVRTFVKPSRVATPLMRQRFGNRNVRLFRSESRIVRVPVVKPIVKAIVRPPLIERRIIRIVRRIPDIEERRRVFITPGVVPPRPTTVIITEPRQTFVSPPTTIVRVAPRLPVAVVRTAVRPAPMRLLVGGAVATAAVAQGSASALSRTTSQTRTIVSTGTRRDGYWEHNRSVMRLAIDAANIRFTYELPRSGLAALGIQRGTLLLEGSNVGGVTYVGKAYTFSRQCGPAAYEVTGEAKADGARLEVMGRRPLRNGRCEVTGHADETLLLEIVPRREDIDVPAPLLPIETLVSSSGIAIATEPTGGGAVERLSDGGQVGGGQMSVGQVGGGVAVESGPMAMPAWVHDGSVMRLAIEEGSVRFFYDTPRAGLEQEFGIGPDKLLFEGRNVSDTAYVGNAVAYSKQCGTKTYPVTGKVTPDGGRLELTGERPQLDGSCAVAGQRPETLVFELR